MKKISITVFVIVSAIHLVAAVIGHELLQMATKPLLMLLLLLYYIVSVKEERSMAVIAAIVLSLAGDVLLMYSTQFVEGLVAFLASHVCYIVAYRQHRDEPSENVLQGVHRIRLAFPIILAASGLVIVLYPLLGDLKVPVIIYAAVLALMALQALFRYGRTSSASFWMVFLGAMLFMISDSTLAINKFLTPVSNAHFWIMLTYVSAQFMIVRGLVRHAQ